MLDQLKIVITHFIDGAIRAPLKLYTTGTFDSQYLSTKFIKM